MENNILEPPLHRKQKKGEIYITEMTNETNDYETEKILDDEIDVDVLREQEYIEDLHMRYESYLELIEEFEN